MKEFADDNFRFDKNGRKFCNRVENCVGKGKSARLRAISPSPTVFTKDTQKKGLFGKRLIIIICINVFKFVRSKFVQPF